MPLAILLGLSLPACDHSPRPDPAPLSPLDGFTAVKNVPSRIFTDLSSSGVAAKSLSIGDGKAVVTGTSDGMTPFTNVFVDQLPRNYYYVDLAAFFFVLADWYESELAQDETLSEDVAITDEIIAAAKGLGSKVLWNETDLARAGVASGASWTVTASRTVPSTGFGKAMRLVVAGEAFKEVDAMLEWDADRTRSRASLHFSYNDDELVDGFASRPLTVETSYDASSGASHYMGFYKTCYGFPFDEYMIKEGGAADKVVILARSVGSGPSGAYADLYLARIEDGTLAGLYFGPRGIWPDSHDLGLYRAIEPASLENAPRWAEAADAAGRWSESVPAGFPGDMLVVLQEELGQGFIGLFPELLPDERVQPAYPYFDLVDGQAGFSDLAKYAVFSSDPSAETIAAFNDLSDSEPRHKTAGFLGWAYSLGGGVGVLYFIHAADYEAAASVFLLGTSDGEVFAGPSIEVALVAG